MSGAATNAGIEYQQRVSALILAAAICRTDLAPYFGHHEAMIPGQIEFETEKPIDDLSFSTLANARHYCQIKRNLSLSESQGSEFAKCLNQFTRQFVQHNDGETQLWLVVSGLAPKSIRNVLKSLLDAFRVNDNADELNPLTVEDKTTLKVFQSSFQREFLAIRDRQPNRSEFVNFAKHVSIITLDVETSLPHEAVVLALLSPISLIPAELLWSVLITQALMFAKKRWIISARDLAERNKRFFKTKRNHEDREVAIDEAMRLTLTNTGRLSTGKEVLLLRKWLGMDKLFMLEFFRFDDECQKRLTFRNKSVTMISLEAPIEILYRSATGQGLSRFVEHNQELFEGEEVVIIPASGIDEVEDSLCANAHRAFLEELLQKRSNILRCLHCGQPISREWSELVELDDADVQPAAGLVHSECRRPVDRVLGQTQVPWFKDRAYLRGFDFEAWLRSIPKGQAVFRQVTTSGRVGSSEVVMTWGGPGYRRQIGAFCVEIELANGTVRHTTTRGKLDRYSEADARILAESLNKSIENAKRAGDPDGYSSESWSYGRYSRIIPMMQGEEYFVECTVARVISYSEHIARRYEPDSSYYAPVMVFRHREDHSLLSIPGAVIGATDPFALARLFENWEKRFGDISSSDIHILESDRDFDDFMSDLESDDMAMLIDPLFGSNDELLSGLSIVPMTLLAKQMSIRGNS